MSPPLNDVTNYKGPRVVPDPVDLSWLDTLMEWVAEYGPAALLALIWCLFMYQAVR